MVRINLVVRTSSYAFYSRAETLEVDVYVFAVDIDALNKSHMIACDRLIVQPLEIMRKRDDGVEQKVNGDTALGIDRT